MLAQYAVGWEHAGFATIVVLTVCTTFLIDAMIEIFAIRFAPCSPDQVISRCASCAWWIPMRIRRAAAMDAMYRILRKRPSPRHVHKRMEIVESIRRDARSAMRGTFIATVLFIAMIVGPLAIVSAIESTMVGLMSCAKLPEVSVYKVIQAFTPSFLKTQDRASHTNDMQYQPSCSESMYIVTKLFVAAISFSVLPFFTARIIISTIVAATASYYAGIISTASISIATCALFASLVSLLVCYSRIQSNDFLVHTLESTNGYRIRRKALRS